jgi:hypothetical protein
VNVTPRWRRSTATSIAAASFFAMGIAIAASSAPGDLVGQGQRSVLDGVFKSDQAERGERTFKLLCSSCHTLPDVTGAKFRERWAEQTVGDIFDYVTNAMPKDDPGSLKPGEYTEVLAFFLRESGYPAGEMELPADKAELLKVRIEPLPRLPSP